MKSALHTLHEMAVMAESIRLDNAAKTALLNIARPSSIFKPTVTKDGNKWCALYGENLQDGVCGFGKTPDEAMRQFDVQWLNETINLPASAI